ncbi:cation/H(+) antiporter 15-like [Diospyros lotus]|uniref:cation/H(+) antiporter 15-like n=1 Tax=Diospyros lotus TaxID=55363 RepID=UPI00224D16A9|nr:cation/H(+) antiporter 15-like [Diospyros lotus]
MAANHGASSYQPIVPFTASFFNIQAYCEYVGSSLTSIGLIRNGSPLACTIPLLMLQLGLAILLSALFHRLLRPLKQTKFVSDMLTGILLGPTIIQRFGGLELYAEVYNGKHAVIMEVLELWCFGYLIFLVGVRTDMGVIWASGKLAWIIGISAFAVPVSLLLPMGHFIEKIKYTISDEMYKSLNAIAILVVTTSFHVTSMLLEKLKLLNSEIGRLALSAALISNGLGWIFRTGAAVVSKILIMNLEWQGIVREETCRVIFLIFTALVIRPCLALYAKRIPEGRTISESHLVTMILCMFSLGYASEAIGTNFYFSCMFLGFAVPAGTPLASGLADKFDFFLHSLLLPAYITDVGRHINLKQIELLSFNAMQSVILLAYAGKILGSFVPACLLRMPYADSFTIGLILSSQGFFDVMLFMRALKNGLISEELFSILTVTAMLYSAVSTPLISCLYDPSKRYVNYRRRTLQHSKRDTELRILACIHQEETVFGLMNLLKAFYPTKERSLGVFVLDLIKLDGREQSLLINHQNHQNISSDQTRTGRIIGAFRHFEDRHDGAMRNHYYTAITPYASMHEDVCALALQKRASLLVIPFYRSESVSEREVKRNVLDQAPCSVGILVDKRIVTYCRADSFKDFNFHVCVLFTCGPDSREALACGARMAESPGTRLTVLRLLAVDELLTNMGEMKLDFRAISEFRSSHADQNDRVEYSEVPVEDGGETSKVLLSMDGDYDFIVVGRRINLHSSLVLGLTEWDNHCDELGIIGDILASSDMKNRASVLVVQQQTTAERFCPQ